MRNFRHRIYTARPRTRDTSVVRRDAIFPIGPRGRSKGIVPRGTLQTSNHQHPTSRGQFYWVEFGTMEMKCADRYRISTFTGRFAARPKCERAFSNKTTMYHSVSHTVCIYTMTYMSEHMMQSALMHSSMRHAGNGLRTMLCLHHRLILPMSVFPWADDHPSAALVQQATSRHVNLLL